MYLHTINPRRSFSIYLFTITLLLIVLSCQRSNEPFITHDERMWLDKNEGKIEILFGYQEPPLAFHNENGDYVGLLIDYQKEIENSLGFDFKFRNFDTWEELITYSQTAHNYIIVGCASTNKREEYLSFTNSIVKIPYVIISQKNSNITSMSSLADKNICTVSNYAVNDYIAQYYPNITPISFKNHIECIRAVSTGDCDAMVVSQMTVTHIIDTELISNLKISDGSGYMNRLAVAISKDDPTLFKIIDKIIDNIPLNRQKEFHQKWIHSRPNKFSKKTWLTIISILSIFILAFIILWLWLISVKKLVAKQTRQIRENEENLRITLNSIGDALIVTDVEGKITRMNPVAQKLTGWHFNEAKDQSLERVFKIVNSTTKERVEDPVKKVLNCGQIIGLANHTVLISKDGREFQIADSGAPIKDETGNISGVVLVFRDVTEEYKMQTALEENEAKYRSLIENSNDAIYLLYNNHFELINKRFEEILGYTSQEMKHINLYNLIATESLEMMNIRIQENDKSKLSQKFEFVGIAKSGKKIPIEVSSSFIPYKDGIANQGIIRDISQNKKHESDLIKAKEIAEESDRLKSVFLATMSHELRTPLNAVIGFSDLIKADLSLEEIIYYSEIINMSGKHLLGVIEDVFDISLIETGDIKIENEPLSINTLLNEVYEIIKNEQTLQNKEHVDLILNNSLENQDTILFSDQKRIKQNLINLLKNALKFTEKGRITFGCNLHKENQQEFIQFFVKDTGIGIPPNKQKLIFEVFRQADDSHTRIYGGSGLGLTICKKLTNLMGGDIWVESKEGDGANFIFTIPFSDNYDSNIDSSKTSPILNFNNKTVLIAEDDETCFSFLEALLSPKGMNCVRVNNGEEAVEYCQNKNKVDLLLMDINMPKMNGYIATEKIKKIRPKIPIIAQTAFAIEGDKEKALAAGCDYYISKPINKNDLFDKILLSFDIN
ncbi:PAS domain S-box protein [Ancylomarina euxinus]|uniref:histidine kinase n=1 Tax=Ancylomarina euxinus TaxID=2283627 RepID=A0A425Y8K9_9BACT|nr:PAS domain S-box protein [Ancylomarina euxinus]MCZ4693270.1 PAS domain S-box protein [Ancylomarina euxinus]MUP13497.1 PAS domain S-box protein [Ancylomarina euxinus]RRG24851.1 PAS domain S-box protein [Ancylomarina euxinus]